MKIRKLAALCKAAKTIYLVDKKNGEQWVGNGATLYPLLQLLNERGAGHENV